MVDRVWLHKLSGRITTGPSINEHRRKPSASFDKKAGIPSVSFSDLQISESEFSSSINLPYIS